MAVVLSARKTFSRRQTDGIIDKEEWRIDRQNGRQTEWRGGWIDRQTEEGDGWLERQTDISV